MLDDETSVSPTSRGWFTANSPGEPPVSVYQFRIELREVKPVVWRRVHILSDMTLADLHVLVQCAMGWDDLHLHRFRVHGRDYGSDSHLPRTMRLDALRLRPGERFFYAYNLLAGWAHDVRLERVLTAERGRLYPICIAGRHACPPEWCCGPQDYEATRSEAMGLAYLEDLDQLVGFASHRLDYRDGARPIFGSEAERHNLQKLLDRMRIRERLWAPFDRAAANAALRETFSGEGGSAAP
jgi:Plasmid pRiA4b ORF-3-like protein